MAIDVTTVVADLGLLTDAELERVQLAVNGEVAVRIQNERATRRMETTIVEAQSVGFTDAEIDQVFENARAQAQKGRLDPDANPSPHRDPEVIGMSNPGTPTRVPSNLPTKPIN